MPRRQGRAPPARRLTGGRTRSERDRIELALLGVRGAELQGVHLRLGFARLAGLGALVAAAWARADFLRGRDQLVILLFGALRRARLLRGRDQLAGILP